MVGRVSFLFWSRPSPIAPPGAVRPVVREELPQEIPVARPPAHVGPMPFPITVNSFLGVKLARCGGPERQLVGKVGRVSHKMSTSGAQRPHRTGNLQSILKTIRHSERGRHYPMESGARPFRGRLHELACRLGASLFLRGSIWREEVGEILPLRLPDLPFCPCPTVRFQRLMVEGQEGWAPLVYAEVSLGLFDFA